MSGGVSTECICTMMVTHSGEETRVRASWCPVHGGRMDEKPPRGHAVGDRRRHLYAVPGPEGEAREASNQEPPS